MFPPLRTSNQQSCDMSSGEGCLSETIKCKNKQRAIRSDKRQRIKHWSREGNMNQAQIAGLLIALAAPGCPRRASDALAQQDGWLVLWAQTLLAGPPAPLLFTRGPGLLSGSTNAASHPSPQFSSQEKTCGVQSLFREGGSRSKLALWLPQLLLGRRSSMENLLCAQADPADRWGNPQVIGRG